MKAVYNLIQSKGLNSITFDVIQGEVSAAGRPIGPVKVLAIRVARPLADRMLERLRAVVEVIPNGFTINGAAHCGADAMRLIEEARAMALYAGMPFLEALGMIAPEEVMA